MEQQSPDLIAVELVALDGHRMALEGIDRIVAIKLMCEKGIKPELIAHRLLMKTSTLHTFAKRNDITLPRYFEVVHWTAEYVEPRRREKNKERKRLKRLQEKGNREL